MLILCQALTHSQIKRILRQLKLNLPSYQKQKNKRQTKTQTLSTPVKLLEVRGLEFQLKIFNNLRAKVSEKAIILAKIFQMINKKDHQVQRPKPYCQHQRNYLKLLTIINQKCRKEVLLQTQGLINISHTIAEMLKMLVYVLIIFFIIEIIFNLSRFYSLFALFFSRLLHYIFSMCNLLCQLLFCLLLSHDFLHLLKLSEALFNLQHHIIALFLLFVQLILKMFILFMHCSHLNFIRVGDFHNLFNRYCFIWISIFVIHSYHRSYLVLQILRLLFIRKHQLSSIFTNFVKLFNCFGCYLLLRLDLFTFRLLFLLLLHFFFKITSKAQYLKIYKEKVKSILIWKKFNNVYILYFNLSLRVMIFKQVLFIIASALAAACYKNTTLFWQKALNQTQINYQSFSGYQQIDWYYGKGQSGMFYNLFGAVGQNVMVQSETTPLIIWLQGGPGSGSQFGAFTQVGPVRIQNGVPKRAGSQWNIFGHLLFIDSPLNVGFSYYGQRHSKTQVNTTSQATDHLINFLYNFYNEFPSLKKCPLYITGESFAGHYIPNLAKKILANQTFQKDTGVKLVGISIGDGWTDPINQINFYDSYLWSVGLAPNKFRDHCTFFQTHAIINIYEGKYQNATKYLNDIRATPAIYLGNASIYNFRDYDQIDLSFVNFLNSNKEELGAKVDYIQDHVEVYLAFSTDMSKSYAADVATVLQSIKVLIYNGQNDVLVNTAGVLQYLHGLNWPGASLWKKANKQIWTIYGQVQGWAKVYGNLWFALVNGAGHMVPSDQPQAAFQLFGHFIHNDKDWQQ